MNHYILKLTCKDKKGIVAMLSTILSQNNANITAADQYSSNPEGGHFFIRIEFYLNPKPAFEQKLKNDLNHAVKTLVAVWQLINKNKKLKMGILVSKPDHCLHELLFRWQANDLPVDIPFVISNHKNHKALVSHYNLPYYHLPDTSNNKKEKTILALVKDKTDFLVLARYMQILSSDFLNKYKKNIINIHHSFLPSFKGTDPYKQAFERGVKIIGATAHYVTEKLDEGPIILQSVINVSHKDTLKSLKQKGKTLEKQVLADAINYQSQHRILCHQNKTIVFS